MKKLIPLFICILALCTACTPTPVKQSASAWLMEDKSEIYATVDLTGGWSTEFAPGAVYIYDKEIKKNTECVAMCMTLSEDTYKDYLHEAEESKSKKQIDNAVCYTSDNAVNYLFQYGNMYLVLVVYDKSQADDIFHRLTFSEDSLT